MHENKMPHATSLECHQIKHFFEVELGVPELAVTRLAAEGIKLPEDMIEITSENTKTVVANLRRPGEREPDGEAGRTFPNSPFKFEAKETLRLQNACDIMEYYETLRHDVPTGALVRDVVIKIFKLEHDALIERKSLTIVTPRASSNLNVVKWTESFLDLSSRLVRVRNIPLTCAARETVEVDCTTPLILLAGCCYAVE